jgi:hypothetical protein
MATCYAPSWDEFAEKFKELYLQDPKRVRYRPARSPVSRSNLTPRSCKARFTMKYCHIEGKLVFKGTDDKVVSPT